MKKVLYSAIVLLLSGSCEAIKIYPPTCNGPAQEITPGPGSYGSSSRDVTYRTGWLAGRRRAHWHDKTPVETLRAPRMQRQPAKNSRAPLTRRTVR